MMKCEAKARGREIRGSGMAVAMAAPTMAWGSSSMCYDFSMIGVAFLIISFWVWKTMRADYDEEDILTLSLILAGTAWALSWGWKWWGLAGVLVGVVLVQILWCRLKKWNAWEWGDVVSRASLVMGTAAALGKGWWIVSSVMGVGALGLWGLAKTYRKIGWYKSGKAGLVGLIGGMWWVGVWTGLAPGQIYKVYLAGWILVGLAVAIYLRAGRVISEDWRDIKKLWPRKQ